MHILKRESSGNVGIHLVFIHYSCYCFFLLKLNMRSVNLFRDIPVHEARLSKLHREKYGTDGCTSS